MTNERKIEILRATVNKLKYWSHNNKYDGICAASIWATDTNEELNEIREWLRSMKPTYKSKFFWNLSYNWIFDGWWWRLNRKGFNQRVKFLEYLIEKLSK